MQQTLIIGLGQFGMALARALASHGVEVQVVDIDENHIAEIAPYVDDAILMDAMDEEALAGLMPSQRDTCVCAIGGDNREGSIIVTALLKQLGATKIIARATDRLHARILSLVGADEVINPEESFGQRLALRLAWRNALNVMQLGGGLVLTELKTPDSFLGRSLVELELPRRFSVTVAALRSGGEGDDATSVPDPNAPLTSGSTMLLVGTEDALRELTQRS